MAGSSVFPRIEWAVVASTCLLLAATPAAAGPVTYTRDYTYQASELDSKVSSRTIALEQVKRLLLEEVGTYLMSQTVVKDFEVTKDQVVSFTAGMVNAVVLDENWDGKAYFLRAKMSADPDEILRNVRRIQDDQGLRILLEETATRTRGVLQELEALQKTSARNPGAKGPREQYANAVNELDAIAWFQKGMAWHLERYVTGTSERINQEAMRAFDKAIELNPQYADAYAQRAAIHNDRGQYVSALRDSEQALALNPNHRRAYTFRGAALTGLGKYPDALQALDKAVAVAPQYVWAYCNRSWTYFMMKDYPHALEEAETAIGLRTRFACGYFRRGRALDALNQFDAAIESFDKALALEPRFAPAFLQRGHALRKLGKKDQAMEDYKRAARLGNGDAQTILINNRLTW